MNNRVSKVYSEAFFTLSLEKDKLDIHKKDLLEIEKVLNEYEEINQLLLNPNVTKDDKKQLISKVFSDIDVDTLNLLKVLIDKSRFLVFKELVKEYRKNYNINKNIAEGIVYSANKLDQSDLNNLILILEKKFEKKVELENKIDETLIGGISVFIDGKRIDNSIKSRLEVLRSSLKERG
ncbi:ATP synthase F1 subunit delta [Helcococcus ovis]|uniref:ATP synthase subunit delta n=1 Tax=Helcococcus ovis TaxID=72026 RepID=A0A4R9C3W8_9FIRM|nr:ATP synthase F1 subunit delta [Helcococcus ovis]TFF64819.1 ATP synthase F1 subunit delta [Helcococcus ovis]TFF65861.1 ATP synthase F1 subunit delta [Helcococcus ovis]TFF67803.1 ATP synthase F1 subunit delta [Helcococcus ovis]WNZ01067.1 ATP synthase F1 subunit delta [Helcococcus ovis]